MGEGRECARGRGEGRPTSTDRGQGGEGASYRHLRQNAAGEGEALRQEPPGMPHEQLGDQCA